MAITATTQIVHDGTRNVTMLLTGLCDGTGGDETNVVKVDVSALDPNLGTVKVEKITYDVGYGVVKLSWDAVTPVDFLVLEGLGAFDFTTCGGLVNTAGETATGDIVLSTVAFDLNSSYSILLKMIKKS